MTEANTANTRGVGFWEIAGLSQDIQVARLRSAFPVHGGVAGPV